MYGLSAADEDIQARARAFADELIPFEVEAELSGGLPDDVTAAHKKRAIELGLFATNLPRELGGGGCTTLQQVLVQEQVGRVTNALGWVAATPPSWFPPVATADQLDALPAAHDPRRARGVLRDHRGRRGLRRRRDRGDRPPRTATSWVLNGVKWHVTSFNTADYCFFQAKKTDDPERGRVLRRPSTCSSSSTCRAPACPSSARPPTRTRSATTTPSSRSRTSACPPPTWSARKATGCFTRASGSASSG